MSDLSHQDERGLPRMVDVGEKPVQRRRARARGMIRLSSETLQLISEERITKGSVLTVAQLAGVQAAKRTAELVPLCHQLNLDHVDVRLRTTVGGVIAECAVQTHGRTGVEMEALTAVSVALLTVYDMCKAVDKQMCIGEITLEEKTKEDVS